MLKAFSSFRQVILKDGNENLLLSLHVISHVNVMTTLCMYSGYNVYLKSNMQSCHHLQYHDNLYLTLFYKFERNCQSICLLMSLLNS